MKVEFTANTSFESYEFTRGQIVEVDEPLLTIFKGSWKPYIPKKTRAMKRGYLDNNAKEYRILIVMNWGIGNGINKTPLIQATKKHFSCEIDLLIEDKHLDLFRDWPLIRKIYTVSEYRRLDQKPEYDLVFNTVPTEINLNALGISGSHVRTGANSELPVMHEVEANMKILDEFGYKGEIPETVYEYNREEAGAFIDVKYSAGQYIAVCAGWDASLPFWSIKDYGHENYNQLLKLMLSSSRLKDYKFLVLGTGDEGRMCNGIEDKRVENLVGRHTIQETAHILSKCSFYIGNDTGLAHIASALGVRTYVIFGPTSEIKNRPYRGSIVISRDINCRPCQFTPRWRKCNNIECLKIDPADILKNILHEEFKREVDIQEKKIEAENNKVRHTIAEWKKFNHVLIIKSQGMGNLINMTPTISAVFANHNRGTKIDVLCRKEWHGLLEGHPFINKLWSFDNLPNGNDYDLIINGVPNSFDKNKLNTNKPVYMNDKAYLKGNHEVDVNTNILNKIGPNILFPGFSTWAMFETDKNTAVRGKYFVVSAGYSKSVDSKYWALKNWGAENYGILIGLLLKQFKDYSAVIIGLPGEDAMINYLPADFKNSKRVINLCGKMPLKKVSGIIRYAEFMVANDSGLGHVAAAHGVKTFTIFGPTSRKKNQPYRYGNIIESKIDCSPCQFTERWEKCDWKNLPDCMKSITPDMVLREISKSIKDVKYNHDLALIVSVYNRADLLISTLQSLSACNGIDKTRVVFVDDHSDDPQVKTVIERFAKVARSVEHYIMPKHKGRDKYAEILNKGVDLAEAEALMFVPADFVCNPQLLEEARRGVKLFNKDIGSINYFWDSREQCDTISKFNDSYDYIFEVDGFGTMISAGMFDCFRFGYQARPYSSGVWRHFHIETQGKGLKHLRFNQGLIEHIGNDISAMNPESRRKVKLNAKAEKLNLYKPLEA